METVIITDNSAVEILNISDVHFIRTNNYLVENEVEFKINSNTTLDLTLLKSEVGSNITLSINGNVIRSGELLYAEGLDSNINENINAGFIVCIGV